MHGYGTYKWADGKVYTGYFVDGIREGIGSFNGMTEESTKEDGPKEKCTEKVVIFIWTKEKKGIL